MVIRKAFSVNRFLPSLLASGVTSGAPLLLFALPAHLAVRQRKARGRVDRYSSPSSAVYAQVHALKVTILSTMLADQSIGEWGFSALVEADGRRVLVDTGNRPATVLQNA